MTSWPRALPSPSVNCFTTLKLTSASSSAMRISLSASSRVQLAQLAFAAQVLEDTL
jgi:hypothetical protein